MKKESLQITTVKTLLAILLFAGMGIIILGGGCIIWEYSKNATNNQITKLVDEEGNYYDALEKKCDNTFGGCCLSSLSTMRENNYKEADENGRCPEGFFINGMKCVTSYQWCEPIGENCTKEGRLRSLEEGLEGFPCCDGLNQRIHYDLINDECALLEDVAICINCPNGKCGARENKCNCPEDCGDDIDTSDWQTYRNEEFGFEVKYPEEFAKQKIESRDDLLLIKKSENGSSISMIINIKRSYKLNYFDAEEIKIGDKTGYKYFFQEGAGYSGVMLIQLGQDTLEIVYDVIGGEKNKEDFVKDNFNQIISSFKFIEKSDISDWQTYRNEEFGFEFKYLEN